MCVDKCTIYSPVNKCLSLNVIHVSCITETEYCAIPDRVIFLALTSIASRDIHLRGYTPRVRCRSSGEMCSAVASFAYVLTTRCSEIPHARPIFFLGFSYVCIA